MSSRRRGLLPKVCRRKECIACTFTECTKPNRRFLSVTRFGVFARKPIYRKRNWQIVADFIELTSGLLKEESET